MKIARVFPRRTRATPADSLAFADVPGLLPPEVDAVHISVVFTWDKRRAEQLAREWERIAPVEIGGPAYGQPGGEFTPGIYLAPGYTITSRGCPNRCWFCSVPKREGALRELPIRDGWNVLDDNLLATSREHFAAVLSMLGKQNRRAEFTGGLEAAILTDWHVDALASLHPRPVAWLAYDGTEDREPVESAIGRLKAVGFNRYTLRVYMLIGFPRDTREAADKRLRAVAVLGADPMAMLWRNEKGDRAADWIHFAKLWARPAHIYMMMKTEKETSRNV